MQANQPKLSVLKIDGINDAPALANVGFALGSGTAMALSLVTLVTNANRVGLFELNRASS